MAYCMAMVLMFLKVFQMDGIGSLNLSSSSFIDGMCDATTAHAVITMSGSISQPLATMFSTSGLYLLALASSVYEENILLQYVNLMSYMVRFWSIFVEEDGVLKEWWFENTKSHWECERIK